MIDLSEFQLRRRQLMADCAPSSLFILPAAVKCTRSNDTQYPFRQDSNFWYLTGFNEAQAWLVMSNQLSGITSDDFAAIMFVLPSDPLAEIWHGRRLGVDAAPIALGVDEAYSVFTIEELLPELLNGHEHLYYTLGIYPSADRVVQNAIATCKSAPKQSMLAPKSMVDVSTTLHAMRRIKSRSEIALMREAAMISAEAHKRAMRFAQPGVYEFQIAAEIHHEFAMRGATHPAYGTIVGSGKNACILHYTENADQVNEGDLILIDAGCELHGYAADITRTFPANGQFTEPQRALYELVLEAQLAALQKLQPASTIAQAMQECVTVITKGLVTLGILHGVLSELIANEAWRPYFMHGLGHYLGLDVHDVGAYKHQGNDIPLQPGVVITVEPGLYISEQAQVPAQFRGIGIRIEDDIVITADGHEILTASVPKEISAIEEWMRYARV